ncbi:helix-turn-helix transcriptional regulator [Patescibacteria group bacterium]|nr:helix-turn-helix transcriptional regulator [Patescibacteria group bacterium]MBU1885611.1 helix-turn-helix transcriptional regulator [Patescibacteria group bacterium]
MKINLKRFYPWEKHRKELLKNSEFRQAVEDLRPEYEVARAMIEARIKHDLTQKELAEKMDTKQSVISRVENMQTTPSLSFLKRFAKVFGGQISLKFSKI